LKSWFSIEVSGDELLSPQLDRDLAGRSATERDRQWRDRHFPRQRTLAGRLLESFSPWAVD
jgi:hypothetical protein